MGISGVRAERNQHCIIQRLHPRSDLHREWSHSRCTGPTRRYRPLSRGVACGSNVRRRTSTAFLEERGGACCARRFTQEMSTRRVKYNRRRFFDFLLKPSRDKQLTWERQAAENQASTFQQLEEFFESGAHPLDGRAEEYFCSELVVHAFERCGVVSRAVLIPNNPTFIAPGDLAKDATYGYLVGFMAKGPEFEVPDDDALRFQPTLQEIFSN